MLAFFLVWLLLAKKTLELLSKNSLVMVGIVTTLDGIPVAEGEIAGPIIAGHENFQNGQKFINGGGQELVRETALANIQQEVVEAEQGVNISELHANARVKEATGEAESIRVTGEARADAYRAGVEALGSSSYTALQLMQVIGDRQVRVVPDVSVSGSNNGGGLVDGLLGMLLWNQASQHSEMPIPTTDSSKPPAQNAIADIPEAISKAIGSSSS